MSEHIQRIPLGSSVASMQPLGFFLGLRGCCGSQKGSQKALANNGRA